MTHDTDLLARVDTMIAGPEMDALVAQRIMHYRWFRLEYVGKSSGHRIIVEFLSPDTRQRFSGGGDWIEIGCDVDPPAGVLPDVPKFSTDIADAWRVLEKFHSSRQDVTINGFDPYFCEIEDAEGRVIVMAEAPTAPLVICRAALRALLQ